MNGKIKTKKPKVKERSRKPWGNGEVVSSLTYLLLLKKKKCYLFIKSLAIAKNQRICMVISNNSCPT